MESRRNTPVTLTMKEHEPVLRAASVAVHVTVVAPTLKSVLLGGEHVTDNTPLTASTAVTAGKLTASALLESVVVFTVKVPGHVIFGACASEAAVRTHKAKITEEQRTC